MARVYLSAPLKRDTSLKPDFSATRIDALFSKWAIRMIRSIPIADKAKSVRQVTASVIRPRSQKEAFKK